TITGRSDWSTSRSKVSSVSSSIVTMLQPAEERAEPQQRDLPRRLEHDRAAHFRAALLAVDEADRDLDHAEALAQRPVRRLDLERVAARGDRAQVDRLEHGAPVTLEAAGEVADPDAEQRPRVEGAAGRDEAPHEPPVVDLASRHVAGAEHEVGVRGRFDEARDVGRAV